MWGTRKISTIITEPGREYDTKSKDNRIKQKTKTKTSKWGTSDRNHCVVWNILWFILALKKPAKFRVI